MTRNDLLSGPTEAQRAVRRLPEPLPLSAQAWPPGTAPHLSVCFVTYNHLPFVRQALDAILAQETTFPVEILAHDDASTDGTAEILRDYVARYPGLFVPLFQRENQYSRGLKPNVNFNYPRVRGEYVAYCEGDDYWIEVGKLQRQVDFLERHPDCILCCHNAWELLEDGTLSDYVGEFEPKDGFITYRDLVSVNFIPTASVVVRSRAVARMPPEIHDALGGDWVLWAHLTRLGKLAYLDFKGSVRRRHGGGVWAGRSAIGRLEFRAGLAEEVNRMMGGVHRAELRTEVARIHDRIVQLCRASGDTRAALRAAGKAWVRRPTRRRAKEIRLLATLIVRGRLGALRRRWLHG